MSIRRIRTTGEVRVETGIVKFDDDWPGIFIRGDNAFHFHAHLEQVLNTLTDIEYSPFPIEVINGLSKLLKSCDVREMKDD